MNRTVQMNRNVQTNQTVQTDRSVQTNRTELKRTIDVEIFENMIVLFLCIERACIWFTRILKNQMCKSNRNASPHCNAWKRSFVFLAHLFQTVY